MIVSQLSDIVCTIIIMSLSGSALILLLFAFKPLIRHRLPKSVQYFLWLITLAALLIPVSKLIAIPQAPSNIILSPVHTIVEQSNVIVEEVNTFPQTSTNTEQQTDTANIPAAKPVLTPELTATTLLITAYMLIALIVLSFNIFSYIRFTKRVRRHRTRARMEELYQHIGLCGDKMAPRLYRSTLATTPMLIGFLKPEIVLPDREYTDVQIQSILKHELTHLRRRDVAVKWLSIFACALHWFNPFVWLARREIDRICELSCDEAVIRNLDQGGKRSYGETLISVAADTKASRAVLSTTMCEEKEVLKERLNVIMKYQKRTWFTLVVSTLIIVMTIFTVFILGAGAVPSSAPSDNKADALEPASIQSVLPSATPEATPEPASTESVSPSAMPKATPESASTESVSATATTEKTSPPSPSGKVIKFKDPIVEKAIRTKLNKPEGPITDQDMLKITSFTFKNTYGKKIETLDDLRWCKNLTYLTLWDTNIKDISVLNGMRDLVEFQCNKKLKNFTPLLAHKNLSRIALTGVNDSFLRKLMAHCSKLTVMDLYQSDISSKTIRMLADRYELSVLSMNFCGISDISPFVGFKGLEYLSLEDNLIEDISPLAENPQLSRWGINLSDNKITDWSPLENMTALYSLSVRGNPVTESSALEKLERKGCIIHR